MQSNDDIVTFALRVPSLNCLRLHSALREVCINSISFVCCCVWCEYFICFANCRSILISFLFEIFKFKTFPHPLRSWVVFDVMMSFASIRFSPLTVENQTQTKITKLEARQNSNEKRQTIYKSYKLTRRFETHLGHQTIFLVGSFYIDMRTAEMEENESKIRMALFQFANVVIFRNL